MIKTTIKISDIILIIIIIMNTSKKLNKTVFLQNLTNNTKHLLQGLINSLKMILKQIRDKNWVP